MDGLPNPKRMEDTIIISEERKVTDVTGIVLMTVYLLGFAGFAIYMYIISDLRKIDSYDSCGNFCGSKNEKRFNLQCSGKDLTKFTSPVEIKIKDIYFKTCVDCQAKPDLCNDQNDKTNTSPENSFSVQEIIKNIKIDAYWMFLCGLLASVISAICLVLLIYATACIVWSSLVITTILYVVLLVYLILLNILLYAILSAIAAVFLILIMIFYRRKIRFTISLLKEARKAIRDMPLLIVEPVLTFIAICTLSALWVIFLLICTTADNELVSELYIIDGNDTGLASNLLYSDLIRYDDGKTIITMYRYVRDTEMLFILALCFSIFTYVWLYKFFVDCQNMIIAGAVVRWYFIRDKSNLQEPIRKSTRITIKYHLGTLAAGSLIVTIMHMIRLIIEYIMDSVTTDSTNGLRECLKQCTMCICARIEECLQYFTKCAYIVTAMNGCGFCKAGKLAFLIITKNAFNILAIKAISGIVFNLLLLFVIVIPVALLVILTLSHWQQSFYSYILLLIFSALIANMILSSFQMAVDTILICYCHDFELNDGSLKPFYMSPELQGIFDSSYKYFQRNRHALLSRPESR